MTGTGRIDGQGEGTYGSIEAAEGWRRTGAVRAQLLTPVTERMLDLAGIGTGNRVLDVAAGTGEQTLLTAHRVGPDGSVLAIDISSQMLARAAEAANQAGLGNVETRILDARDLDLEPESLDAAISRLALMLIPDRDRVLAGIHHALKPGKKFAALVMATAEQCPFIALPLAAAARRAGTPSAPFGDPGMFALGDPAVLVTGYRRAGFREVAIEPVAVQRRIPSIAAALQICRDTLPEIPELLAHVGDAEREAAWSDIEAGLRAFNGPDGLVVPHTYLIGVGTK
jgi:ubiquinone/menaquinone biosynthesis C-methylase UbiE